MEKIVVGMSGGVDSSIVAYLLKKQGYEVVGVFMRNWDSFANNDILGNPNINLDMCQEEKDWQDVIAIGKQLNIKVQRVDFIKTYWDNVFQDLINKYKMGRTPNPDILCNKYIKFGVFYKWVFQNIKDVKFIATGHYASIENNMLKKPKDLDKDQTYFLAQINKNALKKTLFPLANLTKQKVREIANKNKLLVANKKDSMGICFVGKRKFALFLQNYISNQPGDIIDVVTKKIIGKHIGTMYYTIGQRKGLNLGGMSEPYYVAGYDVKNKKIYVAPQSKLEYLMSDEALITHINWLWTKTTIKNIQVKFRYKSLAIEAQIKWENNNIRVFYFQGHEAVTPGQQAVFYNNNICLGGGVIDKIYWKGQKKPYI